MGQCCPAEDANKVFDYRVDTMNSFKQNNRTQIRQTLTESVRRRIIIKAEAAHLKAAFCFFDNYLLSRE